MQLVLRDFNEWDTLLPLTYTRSVADIRIGILTLKDKWEKRLQSPAAVLTRDYLQEKYPVLANASDTLVINAAVLPTPEYTAAILALKPSEALYYRELPVAFRTAGSPAADEYTAFHIRHIDSPIRHIRYPWDIFAYNAEELSADFELLTRHKESQSLSDSNRVIGDPEKVFLAPGAKVEASVLTTSAGPIYLAADSEVMEGCLIRGGLALGEGAQLKMGTRIYGATTIGPQCRVGGEVSNSVIFGYSNKAHDGFLGNSVIGEWCNLGADTNNSNLKNNYGIVRVWSECEERYIPTGLQFCGLIMGDHSKSGINTMFNTGTVAGVYANIFGGGFPDKFIPSFSWGGASGLETFELEKAAEVAERVMARRKIPFSAHDRRIMRHIFKLTSRFREK